MYNSALWHTSGLIKWENIHVPTHTNPWGRFKWASAITRLTPHFITAWCLIWRFASIDKSMDINNTECPHLDQVSFKQHKLKLFVAATSSNLYISVLQYRWPTLTWGSHSRVLWSRSNRSCPSRRDHKVFRKLIQDVMHRQISTSSTPIGRSQYLTYEHYLMK